MGPGTTGLSCCRSAVTPLNVAGGFAGWLPAGPPWSLSFPSVTERMGLGVAAFLPALGLGWILHAGCSLAPGASLGILGCAPGSQKIGVLGAAAAGSGFPGPHRPLSPCFLLCASSLSTSVTVLTCGCPTQRGPSASGSGTLGSPSGLGSHLSFLLPLAPGGGGEVGATSGALCYLLAPLLSLGLPKWR